MWFLRLCAWVKTFSTLVAFVAWACGSSSIGLLEEARPRELLKGIFPHCAVFPQTGIRKRVLWPLTIIWSLNLKFFLAGLLRERYLDACMQWSWIISCQKSSFTIYKFKYHKYWCSWCFLQGDDDDEGHDDDGNDDANLGTTVLAEALGRP